MPKIYLYALWAAMFIHVFFMCRYDKYLVSYMAKNNATESVIVGRCVLTSRGKTPTVLDFEREIGKDCDGADVAVQSYQKTETGWDWKPIWKR